MAVQKSLSEKNKKIQNRNKDNLSVKSIKPLTNSQRQMMDSFVTGINLLAIGSAGTGKTFLAIYLALKNVLSFDPDRKDRILFIRSSVPTRNVGFLPGSLEEKNDIYALPFKQIINQLCENGTAWDILNKKKLIEFQSTSYLRGLTFDNTIIIIDEIQNIDAEEMKTILTRVGENTQVILCGDSKQDDLFRTKEKSCFNFLQEVTRRLPDYFDVVNFLPQDIVRSGFVKQLILVMEDI